MIGGRWRSIVVLVVTACSTAIVGPPGAEATLPGLNGRLVVSVSQDIFTVDPDGSDAVNLTNGGPCCYYSPVWAPDASKIAFVATGSGAPEIYTMNPDGSGTLRLTTNASEEADLAWSPDGKKIAFWSDRTGNRDIWVMNADGTGQTQLTSSSDNETAPDWSPDGSKIVYERQENEAKVYVMTSVGSNQSKVGRGSRPGWSPDGARIVHLLRESLDYVVCDRVWVMRADGTDPSRFTRSCASSPNWSPDGLQIAHASRTDLVVARVDGSGAPTTFTLGGANNIDSYDWHAVPRPPGLRLIESGGPTTVTEGGGQDTYTLALATKPSAQVTVTIDAGPQVEVAPDQVVVRPQDWTVPRTITVTAVDDDVDEPSPEVVSAVHLAVSQDAAYDGVQSVLPVEVVDDDDPWQYFALGDGIASGHGLADAGPPCHVSPSGFPGHVAAELAKDRTLEAFNLACSGATAAAAPGGALPRGSLDTQVTDLLIRRTPGLAVTSISVGGSDLGFDDPYAARDWLCEQLPAEAKDHADQVGEAVGTAVGEQVGRLLADPGIVVVLSELYQPLNESPTWLNDPGTVGGVRRLCDLEEAVSRAEHGVRAVNAALSRVREEAVSAGAGHRVRIAFVAALFEGREGGSPGCGSSPPAEPSSFVQHPQRGYSSERGGDCVHPNERGARAIADAVVAGGDAPVPDATPPSTTFFTPDGTILLSVPGVVEHPVVGRSVDDGAGVASVLVSFAPDAGSPVSVLARCPRASRFSCKWSVLPPSIPGRYLVTARAVDRAGNVEAASGGFHVLVV